MNTEEGLIGWWKLAGNCQDSAGERHGKNHGVTFADDADVDQQRVAFFDGVDSFVELPDKLMLAHRADGNATLFAVSAWVKLDSNFDTVPGDILSKYDATARRGMNLSVTSSAPGYSSVSDARCISFGIDNGTEGQWTDCGRPWRGNTLITTLTVFEGELYAGISGANHPRDASRLFRYVGAGGWVDCGRVGRDPEALAVQSAMVHKGGLYAAVGEGFSGLGRKCEPGIEVYRYEGDTQWRACGRVGDGIRIWGMASFKGDLYAGTSKSCYRYDGDREWEFCGDLPVPGNTKGSMFALTAHKGSLYGARAGTVFRFDGDSSWTPVGERQPFGTTQIHTLGVYQGRLHAGTWPYGKVLCYDDEGDAWLDCGEMGLSRNESPLNEVMDLTVYSGKLYSAVIPRAEVYRHDGDGQWLLQRQLVDNPDFSHLLPQAMSRVTCLTVCHGRLYAGTGSYQGRPEIAPRRDYGRVFALDAGKNVSYDHDISAEWTHLAVVRSAHGLALYVNGSRVAQTPVFGSDLHDIGTPMPLLIGTGAQSFFSGYMRDIRLYRGAFDDCRVRQLYDLRRVDG